MIGKPYPCGSCIKSKKRFSHKRTKTRLGLEVLLRPITGHDFVYYLCNKQQCIVISFGQHFSRILAIKQRIKQFSLKFFYEICIMSVAVGYYVTSLLTEKPFPPQEPPIRELYNSSSVLFHVNMILLSSCIVESSRV